MAPVGKLYRALTIRKYAARRLPGRSKRTLASDMLRGARSETPPPAIRRCFAQEVSAHLECPGQIGRPARMNADSAPGFSGLEYRAAEVGIESCEVSREILLPLEGRNPSQGATVG